MSRNHAIIAEGKTQVSMAACKNIQLEFMADVGGCAVLWGVDEAFQASDQRF
ncbi:predicted protein [Pyrenophora tritici-repentis Pt-1C-BFP]|uniref:Uncharacterized protein n=1 Tax=Pyrenophora tritici-repentis (strain Pt-1C-BFP) TaxID=426418 RepID=B2VXS6_PYRTR|nr:uncharacterized protein PTRG_03322 [Pyrenophora tritici-repentis Pt-1C-BFP]EDU45845.1 predicted protein [Pyrenophora tritici-repentis Pt-1C-BFP]